MIKKILDTGYKVDCLGNVYSLKGSLLKPGIDKKGYLRVSLKINGKFYTKKVHRLVAECFIPNPENKPQVNHINGFKNDNRLENLEWCTAKENVKHAIDNNLFYFNTKDQSVNKIIKVGELNGYSKLTEKDVLEIRSKFKKRVYTRKMLSNEYGVKESCIKDVLSKKSWKHI